MTASTDFCPVCGAANDAVLTHCFACGRPFTAEKKGIPGDEVLWHGRYHLGALLGSGGFSAVYRARDRQEGERDVAIKRISLQGLSAEEMIEATDTFHCELSMLSTLAHPQIPRLYGHFDDQDHRYLVLEYLEGPTLEALLETRKASRKPLRIDEILAIASAGNDTVDQMQVWNAAGGQERLVYHYPPTRGVIWGVEAVAWSPDGRRIASASNNNAVQIWNAP